MTLRSAAALLVLLGLGAAPARAEGDPAELAELRQTVLELRERVDELERDRFARAAQAQRSSVDRSHWTNRIVVGGHVAVNWQNGEDDSPFDEGGFQIWDARIFLDADLSDRVALGEQTLFEHASLAFEWDYMRLGRVVDRPGEVFADLRGLLARDWLNVQIGRFQIPFGEGYRRFSRGIERNPFISTPVGIPWWWDEGARFHGAFGDGAFGYALALSNGESVLQTESDSDKAWTLKLWARPLRGLVISASGHRSGKLGSPTTAGESAIWFGESWITGVGALSPVDTYDHGVLVPDGPTELSDVQAFGLDVVVTRLAGVRLWLAGGAVHADTDGGRLYDRDLRYWMAELKIDGTWLSRRLASSYLALRANGYGTYDRDEGYLLDIRYGWTLGYNMRSLEAYSIALGWLLSDYVTFRAEYTLQHIDLIRGVPDPIRDQGARADYFGMELGMRF